MPSVLCRRISSFSQFGFSWFRHIKLEFFQSLFGDSIFALLNRASPMTSQIDVSWTKWRLIRTLFLKINILHPTRIQFHLATIILLIKIIDLYDIHRTRLNHRKKTSFTFLFFFFSISAIWLKFQKFFSLAFLIL